MNRTLLASITEVRCTATHCTDGKSSCCYLVRYEDDNGYRCLLHRRHLDATPYGAMRTTTCLRAEAIARRYGITWEACNEEEDLLNESEEL